MANKRVTDLPVVGEVKETDTLHIIQDNTDSQIGAIAAIGPLLTLERTATFPTSGLVVGSRVWRTDANAFFTWNGDAWVQA